MLRCLRLRFGLGSRWRLRLAWPLFVAYQFEACIDRSCWNMAYERVEVRFQLRIHRFTDQRFPDLRIDGVQLREWNGVALFHQSSHSLELVGREEGKQVVDCGGPLLRQPRHRLQYSVEKFTRPLSGVSND